MEVKSILKKTCLPNTDLCGFISTSIINNDNFVFVAGVSGVPFFQKFNCFVQHDWHYKNKSMIKKHTQAYMSIPQNLYTTIQLWNVKFGQHEEMFCTHKNAIIKTVLAKSAVSVSIIQIMLSQDAISGRKCQVIGPTRKFGSFRREIIRAKL